MATSFGKGNSHGARKKFPQWKRMSMGHALQRGWGISLLEDFQKSTRESPDQPEITFNLEVRPALSRRLD